MNDMPMLIDSDLNFYASDRHIFSLNFNYGTSTAFRISVIISSVVMLLASAS